MESRPEQRCPYCHRAECAWTLSPIAGPGGAEVHTSCGHGLSVDSLLGQTRWHLEVAKQILLALDAGGKEAAPA